MEAYDVFISYRRDGGEHAAKRIQEALLARGYRVFLDMESLRSGPFNTMLLDVIDSCTDFLLILPPSGLDRCEAEQDWVRLEVEQALRGGKNIVPILLRGFEFPQALPASMEKLRFMNGISATTEYFDAFVEKLCGQFLQTKPAMRRRIGQNPVLRRVLPFIAALLLLLALLIGGYSLYSRAQAVFPRTRQEKNTLQNTIQYMTDNLARMNIAFGAYDGAIKACRAYIGEETPQALSQAEDAVRRAQSAVRENEEKLTPLPDTLAGQINQTILPQGDIAAMYSMLQAQAESMLGSLDMMAFYLHDDITNKQTKLAYLDALAECSSYDKDILFYGVNDALLNVDEAALVELKTEMLPTMSYMFVTQAWQSEEANLDSLSNRAFSAYEEKTVEIASLVGDERRLLDQEQAALDVREERLRDLQSEIRETLTPLDGDDFDTLWAKMICANWKGFYDITDACIERIQAQCVQDALEQTHGEGISGEVESLLPVIAAYYAQAGESGYNYGCILGTVQDGESPYQTGDILIAIGDKPIYSYEDYKQHDLPFADVVCNESFLKPHVADVLLIREDLAKYGFMPYAASF